MELYSIRNDHDKQILADAIRIRRLPFKVIIQDIFPRRTVDQNAYYWVIVTIIADYCGYTIKEVHKELKTLFLTGYFPDKKGNWSVRTRSTTELNTVEFSDYIMRITAWAITFLNISIPAKEDLVFNEND